MGEEDSFALGRQSAREEALCLYRMLGHNGNTIEAIRELIAVPPKIERVLRAFARIQPEEPHSIDKSLRFRQTMGQSSQQPMNVVVAPPANQLLAVLANQSSSERKCFAPTRRKLAIFSASAFMSARVFPLFFSIAKAISSPGCTPRIFSNLSAASRRGCTFCFTVSGSLFATTLKTAFVMWALVILDTCLPVSYRETPTWLIPANPASFSCVSLSALRIFRTQAPRFLSSIRSNAPRFLRYADVGCGLGALASVSRRSIGSKNTNVLPWLCSLSTQIFPRCAWMSRLAMANPSPIPEVFRSTRT